MEKVNYRKQVSLLLSVLPEVAKEKSFALHGGTAINLFVRNMPRLSVDIDLTYIPVEDRATSLENIQAALRRIKERIELAIKDVRITDRSRDGKLLISFHEIVVKIEVNLVARGTVDEPKGIALCSLAQGEFDAFCVMPVVPIGQLFGGKICAALDRQHPRDLFDVKHLLENEGFSDEIKSGFLLALISSERPIHEVIDPHLLDQQSVLENHFSGMSSEAFTYQDFEETRTKLLSTIDERLTDEDRTFILSIKGLEPDWSRYDFEKFPAVQWKLLNLRRLKDSNPNKYLEQYEALKSKLEK
ncbi:MAG: nucleotidyl transferase AbiEii/AbiGii toxin family protein [Pyrinomonadaceae bacterium]|nr:nucleotidyl transferase AbiEii/AbiGii toxin family protein [Pyrinomonadaceae bacterium]